MIRSTISGLPGVNAFKRTATGFGLRREAKRQAALAGVDEVSKSGVAAALCHRSPKLRSVLARERARIARAMLADCRFCAHDCRVNRLAGENGLCHAGSEVRFFSAQTEVSDELELTPAFNVALSGCDLRCDFCITGASSWNPRAGAGFDARAMAKHRTAS